MFSFSTIEQFRNIKPIKNFFASKPQGLKNIRLDGLKYSLKLDSDVCVRTIPQKKSVQIINEMTKSLNIEPGSFETLPVELYRTIQNSGKNYINTKEIKEIIQKTGLSEAQFAKEMDNIASMLSVLKPTDLKYEQAGKIFEIELGNKTAKVSFLAKGMSGSVYKIEMPNVKQFIMKKYHGTTHKISRTEGAYAEAAIQKRLYDDGVSDTAALIAANPDNGWIVSEFIDSNYKMRTKGIKIKDYLEKNGLYFDDVNEGMYIKDANGNAILVDFGYIIPKKHKYGSDVQFLTNRVNLRIEQEKAEMDLDSLVKMYKENPKLRFQIIQNLQESTDSKHTKEFFKAFYEQIKDTPQMRLCNDYSEYMLAKCTANEEVITTADKLQKAKQAFADCGFKGDIEDFIGTQDNYNLYINRFNDFASPVFEKLFSMM